MDFEDNQLIEKFFGGDDLAFEQLLKKYLKSVYNFLNQLTKDSSVLDDLAQITFIKVWKNLSRFNQTKKFKVWLFAVAKNTAYDYLKKKKTLPFSSFSDAEGNNKLEKISEDKILPDEILERKELAEELEKKLKEIPDRYRIVLIMRYKDDFSLTEISQILGISYNTVKSLHSRGLARLKQAFLSENAPKTTA